MTLPDMSSPAEMNASEPHSRTRDDHAAERAEDYVEAIAELSNGGDGCRVGELATHFGVSHVTVTRTVARLVREGLAQTEPYRPVRLTAAGAELAKRSRQRHETVLAFLRAIGVSASQAAVDAEGIEHHVSDETLRRMRAVIRERS